MKTLIICEHYPLPMDNGSSQRTMNFANYFSKKGSVDLVYSNGDNNISAPFDSVYKIEKKDKELSFFKKCPFIIINKPLCVRNEYSPSYARRVQEFISENCYDIVLVRYLFNAQYVISNTILRKTKVIIDLDDIISGSLYSSIYAPATKYSLKRKIDYLQLLHFENKCVKKSSKTLVCSYDDQMMLYNRTKTKNIYRVPNVIDCEKLEELSVDDGFKYRHKILFVGALNYRANYEGIEWFVHTIFRYLHEENNQYELSIVGRNPKDNILALESFEGVSLYVNVPDVVPYYKEHGIVVVPILLGGGTRIKIIEASLLRRPILSTKLGASGLQFRDRKELLLFEKFDDFSSKLLTLNDPNFYRSIVSSAFLHAKANFSQNAFNESMKKVLGVL